MNDLIEALAPRPSRGAPGGQMSETIKLCAMLVRHVFAPDDEARDEEMRRPYVEQAMRAKREHDEMRRELAEARGLLRDLEDK